MSPKSLTQILKRTHNHTNTAKPIIHDLPLYSENHLKKLIKNDGDQTKL